MSVMRKVTAILVLLSLVFGLVACGSGEGQKRVVRIAQTGVYVSATAQIMKEKAILEKYLPADVEIEWSQIATGPDLREAIISRNVDIADFSLMTYIAAYENGLPLTLLSFSGSTPINIYSNSSDIEVIDDFSSTSSIAITNKSTNLHIAFLAYCKEYSGDAMKYDDCLSPIPAADAIASLQTSSDYNGAVFSFPMMVKAEENENLKLIADMTDVITDYSIGDGFVTHSDYIEENKDIVDAFLAAQNETLQFISDHAEETAQILASLYGVEEEEVSKVLAGMPPRKEVVGYDKQAELLYEAGILTKEPTKFENLPNYDNIPK
ncbi:MAG: ABC transporter substrate-binding protein [Lachnospiraceae bacterium]|nr:ABC transporter substrate-binding protein [Lachnospiraceae bacterium]